jgi:predicted MFS family arabinose efflux permease
MKAYFYIQLVLLILIDIFFILSFDDDYYNGIVIIDFLLGLVQFIPTFFIAIFSSKNAHILLAYVGFSVIVLMASPLFSPSKYLLTIFFTISYGIAHAFVLMLYILQRKNAANDSNRQYLTIE